MGSPPRIQPEVGARSCPAPPCLSPRKCTHRGVQSFPFPAPSCQCLKGKPLLKGTEGEPQSRVSQREASHLVRVLCCFPPRAEVLLSYSAVRCSMGSVGTPTFCSTVVATKKGGIDAQQPWWVKENHYFKPLSSLEQFLSMA